MTVNFRACPKGNIQNVFTGKCSHPWGKYKPIFYGLNIQSLWDIKFIHYIKGNQLDDDYMYDGMYTAQFIHKEVHLMETYAKYQMLKMMVKIGTKFIVYIFTLPIRIRIELEIYVRIYKGFLFERNIIQLKHSTSYILHYIQPPNHQTLVTPFTSCVV